MATTVLPLLADEGIPRSLSARYKSDFAYLTVKDRMPVILTKAIDTVFRMKNNVSKEFGEERLEELKKLVGCMSKLRNELQTDKQFLPINDGRSDANLWNLFLDQEKKGCNENSPCWFGTSWLYAECYFYRRIYEAVQLSCKLQNIDPFGQQKRDALLKSMVAVEALSCHLKKTIERLTQAESAGSLQEDFMQMLQVSLWGNKCDLSISAGADNPQVVNPVTQLDILRPFILRDDSIDVWRHLAAVQQSAPDRKTRLDIVLDNAGFELFTDLCLAELLLAVGLVQEVHLHGKCLPWFVSDVTPEDLEWTLKHLCHYVEGEADAVKYYGNQWRSRLGDKSWVFKTHDFWTLPHDFSQMKKVAPELYADLGHSDLILFKGDLNYRKLTGDLLWEPTTEFAKALRGFHPAPLCALRALKSDLITGLEDNLAQETKEKNADWMISGNYAIIQLSNKTEVNCLVV